MGLPLRVQSIYWGIGLAVFLFVLWILGNVLLPFIAGMAIAYFLDPTADRLEAMGASRVVATIIITLVAVFAFLLVVGLVVPQLVNQLAALVQAAPDYVSQAREQIEVRFPDIMEEGTVLHDSLSRVSQTIQESSGKLANIILASAFSLVDALVFMVVAPVVAFYMLLDWDRMVATVDGWLPLDHKETIRELARQVNRVLAGFVRGQLTVCAILGVFYAVALMIIGLNFGLVVGLLAGLLTFIPYVGALIGGLLSIGLALFQFWDTPSLIAAVVIVFVIGQMAEGNVLTPKLVGGSIGLHPVWLLFALSAFGSLMGFTGMLIAVPVAAMIGVFSRFGLSRYLEGALYKGYAGREGPTDTDE